MKKFLKDQTGVTMIEVLVTVAILAIVVVPCLSSFVMAQRGNVLAKQTRDAYTQAANLMETLKSDASPLEKNTEKIITENYEGITAFCETTEKYYIVTVYIGDHQEEPEEGSVEPILKGVIARD